jgi:tetratricopeptide (TPR) repeat protein
MLSITLGKLQSAGLLFQREGSTERVYTFKHALVRDAAYDSLLRSHRAVLHGRIAATIEARFPTMAETQPELIARHLTEAGQVQSAVNWWRKAGQRALSRLSFQEAIAHFDHALGLAPSLQPAEDRDRLLAGLWLECAAALRQTQWGGRRMEQAARSALAIGISLNDLTIVGHSLTALAEVAAVRPDFVMFREANRDFLRLELCISEGLHVGVPHLLVLFAHAANALGMPQEALADMDRALTMIEATGEAHSESELYHARGEILLGTGDRAGGEQSFRMALEVGRRQSARGLELRAAISLGKLLDGQRRTDEARDILAPIYARFTEGFATPIMLQAKVLLAKFDRTAGYREPITRQSRAAQPLTYS